QKYASTIGALDNPHNDVDLLKRALQTVGFDVVVVPDAGLAGMHQAVNTHARRLQQAGQGAIGFFYYAGHGASEAGANYLIPVDVTTAESTLFWDRSLRLSDVTRTLKERAGNATHFVVFDACRNTLRLTDPRSRAIVQPRGFVRVDEPGM